jgi:endonuclease YncB( thermonuclease family)
MATFRKPQDERGVYAIRDIRVIDGDAIEATIVLPFEALIRKRIRLRGWWADETEGQYAERGQIAKERLTAFVARGPLWIHAADERCDRYGRLLAILRDASRIIIASEVLGSCQLTEREHKARRDIIVKAAAAKRKIEGAGNTSDGPYGCEAAGPL